MIYIDNSAKITLQYNKKKKIIKIDTVPEYEVNEEYERIIFCNLNRIDGFTE